MHTFSIPNNVSHKRRRRRVQMALSVALGTAACWWGTNSAQADTVTLAPGSDNWISSCSSGATVNNGDMGELRVRASWWGSPGNREPKNFRSLLTFDLGAVPADAELITSATVGLYYFDKPHADPAGRTYEVHSLTNAWMEMGSTWQARDNYDQPDPVYWDSYHAGIPAYQPGGGDFAATAYASAQVPADVNEWMTWDVTVLVKEWVDGTSDNFGLLIKDGDEIESDPGGGTVSYNARFRSREYADSAFRPFLEVTYVPEPSVLAMAGVGLGLLLSRRSRK